MNKQEALKLFEESRRTRSISYTIAAVVVLLLAACSGSDPVEPNTTPEPEKQTAISFCGTMPEEQTVTRAGLEEVLTGDKTFQVWGYKNDAYEAPDYTSYQTVMPDFTVNWVANSAYTTTSNTNDWEYVGQGATEQQRADQTIKYWDFSAKAYRFFGYALGNATADPATSPVAVTVSGGSAADAPTATDVKFTAAVDASTDANIDAAPYFSRLWFSNGNTVTYPDRQFGRPVQLQFVKPFARVRFQFTFAEGLSYGREKLKNIKFRPTVNTDLDQTNNQTIATAGTVTVTYPLKGSATTEAWAVAATPAPTGLDAFAIDYYEMPSPVPDGYPVDAQPTSWPRTPEKWYYVLPAENQGSYTIEVAVMTEEIKTAVVPAEYMSWKPGYEYTYKFKITKGGGITMDIIQVAINDWSNRKSSSHTVYNW